MANKGVLVLQFVAFFVAVRALPECMSPQEFNDKYAPTDIALFNDYMKVNPTSFFHVFLFNSGEDIFIDTKDEIRRLAYFLVNQMITKIPLDQEEKIENAKKEISKVREFCGVQYDFENKASCKYQFVVKFYGCVQDDKALYVFEEANLPLLSNAFVNYYATLESKERVAVMLDIADRFVELQTNGLVHSNITFKHIVFKEKEFDNFKITGLRYVNPEGKEFVGKANHFSAPERCENLDKGLSFQENVFSLAIIFAELEKKIADLKQIFYGAEISDTNRLNSSDTIDGWKTVLIAQLKEIFVIEKGLESLLPAFVDFVSNDLEKRPKSAKDLSIDILEKFVKLDGAENFAKKVLNDKKSSDLKNKSPSFWKNFISCLNFGSNPISYAWDYVINNKRSVEDCNEKYKKEVAPTGNKKQII